MSLADHLQRRCPRVASLLLLALHHAVLLRLRTEAAWSALRGRPAPARVMAAACWQFPIYSQTFVQQELAALVQAGFDLCVAHVRTGPRGELAHPCAQLWPLRRRLVLNRVCGRSDLAHFRARDPVAVQRVLQALSEATGLDEAALLQHDHVLHAFSFARAARAWRASYLHSYFFYEMSLFTWVASQLLGLPRGVSCYADHLLDDYPLKAVRLQLAGSAVTVATSRRIGHELTALHGAPLPGLLVKPNAVDTRSFGDRVSGGSAGSPLRVVSVCRLDPKKGLEHMLDALALLRDQGKAVVWSVLGAPDPHNPAAAAYADSLRQRVDALALQGCVHFHGQADSHQIRAALAAAQVFVAPFVELANGDKDGIPTAVLEAMSAGCAIVATDAGSIPEIVQDGVEALLVPQRDAPALAGALGRLVADPALVHALGSAAVQRARRDFDVRTCELPFHAAVRSAVQAAVPGRPVRRPA